MYYIFLHTPPPKQPLVRGRCPGFFDVQVPGTATRDATPCCRAGTTTATLRIPAGRQTPPAAPVNAPQRRDGRAPDAASTQDEPRIPAGRPRPAGPAHGPDRAQADATRMHHASRRSATASPRLAPRGNHHAAASSPCRQHAVPGSTRHAYVAAPRAEKEEKKPRHHHPRMRATLPPFPPAGAVRWTEAEGPSPTAAQVPPCRQARATRG